MSFQDCVDDISAAAGYPVELVELELEAYISALKTDHVTA